MLQCTPSTPPAPPPTRGTSTRTSSGPPPHLHYIVVSETLIAVVLLLRLLLLPPPPLLLLLLRPLLRHEALSLLLQQPHLCRHSRLHVLTGRHMRHARHGGRRFCCCRLRRALRRVGRVLLLFLLGGG